MVVALLCGTPRQGRIGVGWATMGSIDAAPGVAGGVLTVADFDRLLDELAARSGEGSSAARHQLLVEFLRRADRAETDLVRQLLLGGVRQGALEGLTVEAVAAATETRATLVRRALMLVGDLGEVAEVARRDGSAGLDAMTLRVGRPLRPMLAASSTDVRAALEGLGLVSLEWKLDGRAVQVHRDGADVAVFTRNLNDVTARLPEVVAMARSLPGHTFVLDGELIGLTEAATEAMESAVPAGDAPVGRRPRPFQETVSRFASGQDRGDGTSDAFVLSPFFFDCLHLDGEDLVDRPLSARLEALDLAAGRFAVPRLLTEDAEAAEAFAADVATRGHEGVMVKALDAPYSAGRRGATWRKVKPVLVVDLVVLGAEWGHGRRRGWLSNLHLGARDPGVPGRFVMVGKTFKGLTDVLLRWQTAELLARQVSAHAITVMVRPELVVEIALDGVQRSVRYPGGVALRFARVRRYRPDKTPAEADTIDTLRAMLSDSAPTTAVEG